jgi:hypothetical protein
MGDRRFELFGNSEDFAQCVFASGTGIDGDLLSRIENLGDVRQFIVVGANVWTREVNVVRKVFVHVAMRDIDRNDQYRDAALGDGSLAGHNRFFARLIGSENHVAKDRTLFEDGFEIHLLDKLKSHLAHQYAAGNQHHRRTIAVGFVKSVDEVQASRSAAACAGSQLTGKQRLGTGGESARFFMANMYPFDRAFIQMFGDQVQGIADDAVAAFDASLFEDFYDNFGDFLAHGWLRFGT